MVPRNTATVSASDTTLFGQGNFGIHRDQHLVNREPLSTNWSMRNGDNKFGAWSEAAWSLDSHFATATWRETGLGSGAVHANAVIKGLFAGMKETLRKGGPVAGA
jgi:hypothetical protein